MPYKLLQFNFGNIKPKKYYNVDTDFNITNFIHIDDFGFLFLFKKDHFIGFMDYKNNIQMPWMGEIGIKGNKDSSCPLLDLPSSICYQPNIRACYLIEKGGSNIRKIELNPKYGSSFMGESDKRTLNKYFSKTNTIETTETYIDSDIKGNIYWVVKDLHRCFKRDYNNGTISNYIGNGQSGFSVSNDISNSQLSRPSGIKTIKESIYIADQGNHCIRSISNNINILLGHPLQYNFNPSNIKYASNLFYFMDNHCVKYLSVNDKKDGIIYESPNIVSIDVNNKRDLFVLEKI